jgi:hypothetical protein
MEGAEISDELAVLAEGAVEFLEGDPVGCGDDCMYMVTWTDSDSIGSSGYGLLLELERQGFDARAPVFEAPAVRLHRTATRDQVDAELHVAVGDPVVGTMLRRDDARLVAMADPHTPQERAEYLRLRRQLVAQLEADGQPELAEQVARQVRIQPDTRMSDDAMVMAYYANQFERRSAVFLVDSEESLHDPELPDIPDEPLGARPDTG